MDWQRISEDVDKAQEQQLRQIQAAQQVADVRKAEVQFQYRTENDLRAYLLDLEDTIRFASLSLVRNDQHDYVAAQCILRQFTDGSIAPGHFTRNSDKRFLLMVQTHLEEVINNTVNSMSAEERQQAEECYEALNLIPILRHVALNINRREAAGVVKQIYKQQTITRIKLIFLNFLILIGLYAFLALIYALIWMVLIPISFYSTPNYLILVLFFGIGLGWFAVLRRRFPPGYHEIKQKYKDLLQPLWLDLSEEDIEIGKLYLDRSSQEIQGLLQDKINLSERILGSDWEKIYRGKFPVLYPI